MLKPVFKVLNPHNIVPEFTATFHIQHFKRVDLRKKENNGNISFPKNKAVTI
jgi:hypothetical protein